MQQYYVEIFAVIPSYFIMLSNAVWSGTMPLSWNVQLLLETVSAD